MSIISPFFDKFPKLNYDMDQGDVSITENVTNIFFRLGAIKETLKNPASFDYYEIEEGETPEDIAAKVYRDSGAGWMIMYANYVIDPQFDWPLTTTEFNKYLIEKYRPQTTLYIKQVDIINPGTGYSNGTVYFTGGTGHKAKAQMVVNGSGAIQRIVILEKGRDYSNNDIVSVDYNGLDPVTPSANVNVILSTPSDLDVIAFTQQKQHHYEKIVTITDSLVDQPQVSKYIINAKKVAPNNLDTPYQYYYPYGRGPLSADTTIKDHDTGDLQLLDDTSYTLDEVNQDPNAIANVYIHNVINDNGRTVVEEITSNMVSYYNYELEKNDKKRVIKVIKPAYYVQIMAEFNGLTSPKETPFSLATFMRG